MTARVYHDGIPEPYNTELVMTRSILYNPLEAAVEHVTDLVGDRCDAEVIVATVRAAYRKLKAYEPLQSASLREAGRAWRLCPADEPERKAKACVAAYLGTLSIAADLHQGDIDREEAARRIRSQRQESKA